MLPPCQPAASGWRGTTGGSGDTAPRERSRGYGARVTLGAALAGRDNALNAVRLLLAVMVIFAHATLSGLGSFRHVGDVDLGELAVGGFFTVSGFLIARSRVSLPFGAYLWRRALRIFPAFWVCLVVVAFGFASLSTIVTGQSWDPLSAFGYVARNLGLWIFQPGVADTLPPDAFPWWNGSLWTLFYEFAAYLVAGAILSVAVVRAHRAPAMFGLLALVTVVHAIVPGDAGYFWLNSLQLGGFFAAGMALWSVSDRVRVSHVGAAAAAVVFVTLVALEQVALLGPLPVAYLCLYAGAKLPTRVGARNDVSYGMYVYAFPVEQLLGLAGFAAGGLFGFALVATVLTVPLAWGSWLLVERPALRLRRSRARSDHFAARMG